MNDETARIRNNDQRSYSLTPYMQFEVCRLVGPYKIRYARLCAATTSESDRTFGKKLDTRTTRCILIAIFTYIGASVTTRNNNRDCFPTLRESSSEIQLTLARLRGQVLQNCFLWKRKRTYKD